MEVKAKFKYPVWQNEKNYCIFKYILENEKIITIKGTDLPQSSRLYYKFEGEWDNSEKYDNTFAAKSYEPVIEATKDSIIGYMCTINLIGEKIAMRIYEKYGNDSLKIFDEGRLQELTSIKGIGAGRAAQIIKSYTEQKELHKLAFELQKYGITGKVVFSIYNSDMNLKTIDDIRKNPYKLCFFHGINIHTCDDIARDCVIEEDSIERISAHANYIMYLCEQTGSTGISASDFGLALIRSLHSQNITRANICDITINLIKKGILVCRTEYKDGRKVQFLFRKSRYNDEAELAKKMVELTRRPLRNYAAIQTKINSICHEKQIKLDPIQNKAVLEAIANNLYVIGGFPGAGKTTVIEIIAAYLEKYEQLPMFFMAPAGKAARRIKESTGYEASTIHSFLGLRPEESMNDGECEEISNCTLFIDEYSMVDISLSLALFSRIKENCRVIILGDKDQLQSVSAGAVLRDIIKSNVIPYTLLTKIHRQNGNSTILKNAKKIINGSNDLEIANDFRIFQCDSVSDIERKIAEHYVHYVKRIGIKNVYCILPRKVKEVGVFKMNTILQNMVNPLHPGDKEVIYNDTSYRIGDPVMNTKNDIDVSNGDIGYVTDIEYEYQDYAKKIIKSKKLIITFFGDLEIEYASDQLDNLTLAYAFTCHKSQGSESKIVLTYINKGHGNILCSRNLLYTAITRARFGVEIFTADSDSIRYAIENDSSEKRITSLEYHLRYYGGQFVYI